MLEAAVRDSLEKFRLQEEVAEAGGVDADIAALSLVGACARYREVALLVAVGGGASRVGGAVSWLKLLVGVIDEVLFAGRHGDGRER